MDFEKATAGPKAWKEIWGSGQGISAVKAVVPTRTLVDRLDAEYRAAKARICG
jgi:nitronate monooxygenase